MTGSFQVAVGSNPTIGASGGSSVVERRTLNPVVKGSSPFHRFLFLFFYDAAEGGIALCVLL